MVLVRDPHHVQGGQSGFTVRAWRKTWLPHLSSFDIGFDESGSGWMSSVSVARKIFPAHPRQEQ